MTVGKSIAAGIPLGAYGMTPEVAEVLQRPGGRDDAKPQVAVGGTLFGNPVSMAAARATMGGGADRRGVRPQSAARWQRSQTA